VVEAAHRLEAGAPPATAFAGVDILGRDASTKVSQMTPPGAFIAAQPLSADTDLDSWASEVTHTVALMRRCTTPDAHDEITVDGTAAVLFTYDHCPVATGHYELGDTIVTELRSLGFCGCGTR